MNPSKKIYFDHEKLEVYQKAIAFVAWLQPILETVPKAADVKDHLDRASTSIPLNIAEGNGKFSHKARCRFFDIATGSAFECASGLDVLVAKGKLDSTVANQGKERLCPIVQMLVKLIQRVGERDYGKEQHEKME